MCGLDDADEGTDPAAVDDGRTPEIQDQFTQIRHLVHPEPGKLRAEGHSLPYGQSWGAWWQLNEQETMPLQVQTNSDIRSQNPSADSDASGKWARRLRAESLGGALVTSLDRGPEGASRKRSSHRGTADGTSISLRARASSTWWWLDVFLIAHAAWNQDGWLWPSDSSNSTVPSTTTGDDDPGLKPRARSLPRTHIL